MATRYAAATEVPADRSLADIDRTLAQHGARQFQYGRDDDRRVALVEFQIAGRRVRFVVPMPDPRDREFHVTPTRGTRRTPAAARKEYEQAVRQRWRALLLIIRAKLEAAEGGIATLEDEFLPYTVLADGRTVAEHVQPRIALAYQGGDVPELMPGTR